jgi:hypothetical protein
MMTQKEAKELSLELWTYLAEHPRCQEKNRVPRKLYSKIEELSCRCPLCEMFEKYDCGGCPLKTAGQKCSYKNSAYRLWNSSTIDEISQRKKAAERIVQIISAWGPEE